MKIHDNIKALAKANKTPIYKIEQEVGLSRGSICKWNVNHPTVGNVKKVADYLGVTVDELIRE